MPTFESLKQSVLAECEEDHVGLWSVIREVEDFFPDKGPAAIRDEVLNLLRELLVSKEIEAGFPAGDGTFRTLGVSAEKVLDRIDSEWPVGHRPTIGESLWFTRAKGTGRRSQ